MLFEPMNNMHAVTGIVLVCEVFFLQPQETSRRHLVARAPSGGHKDCLAQTQLETVNTPQGHLGHHGDTL
jgi:hypothetical protein